ncbi:MAG: phosphocholine cytidylyltransferase family protein [Solobacterium sp.]|nr:phosphocholine cytidylyltransferase family protein [Solobacterium sp.]
MMTLPRYEFELLSWLERSGTGHWTIRELSDSLCISGNEVRACLERMLEDGRIQQNSEGLSVTAAGLAALEPYRVKRALIVAAGFGSRMMPATKERPKPMVTVNGVRLIDTLLDALTAAGVRDITIVRGYRKESFEELKGKYPFLSFVDNDEYDTTNNISSTMKVLDLLEGGCWFCEADLYITNPGIITKYQYASNILGSWSLQTDDWSFQMKDGYITDYRKGNTYCWNYYGISYWTPEDCRKLREDFAEVWNTPGGKDWFWEFIPLVLKKDRYRVEIRQCRKQDIMEIDNYYELVRLDPSYETGEDYAE